MFSVSKECAKCEIRKPLEEFYVRSGYGTAEHPAIIPGHYVSECKECMKARSKAAIKFSRAIPIVPGEIDAIAYLKAHRISAAPGKLFGHAWTDVIALGCIGIEVKHAKLESARGKDKFTFVTTPSQQKKGFSGELVMLVCEYPTKLTHHLFYATDPVFYMKDRLKVGFTFTPGMYSALKHGNNRVVMTQGMMNEARDKIDLIWKCYEAYFDQQNPVAS